MKFVIEFRYSEDIDNFIIIEAPSKKDIEKKLKEYVVEICKGSNGSIHNWDFCEKYGEDIYCIVRRCFRPTILDIDFFKMIDIFELNEYLESKVSKDFL